MSNIVELFHKLECIPWEYIEVENENEYKEISSVKIKQENDIEFQESNENIKDDKKPTIVNSVNECQNKKPKKNNSFEEKIKSIKTITNFSNSLNFKNNSNSNIVNNNNNNNNNNNSNLNLTILPLTLLSQNIPNTTFNDNDNNLEFSNSKISIPNSNSNVKLESISKNNFIRNVNNKSFYIKYHFNGDNNTYLFMITDMKNIWYEYIDSEEAINIKKKKNAVNFETQNNLIDLIHNSIKSKDVNSFFKISQYNNDKQYLCVRLSVPYMYVTFNWDFECSLLSGKMTLPVIKKENQERKNDLVAKLDGSKIFYEHLTLPMTLMISELHRRIQRYEEVIMKKEKNIKILYDQLLLLEETPPKRFKMEEFNKKIFDDELRYSMDINSSEQTVFTQEDLVDIYKQVTTTVLSKTYPNLLNDENNNITNNERLSLIPTLLTESNELKAKETIPNNLQSNNINSFSSLSYNDSNEIPPQDDEDNNNQSLLEELEKEKNQEAINNIMKNKRNKIETIINKKKDKKKVKKRKLV